MSALPETVEMDAVTVTVVVAPGVDGNPLSLVNLTRHVQVKRWMMSSTPSSGAERAVVLMDSPVTPGAKENVGLTLGVPLKDAAVIPNWLAVKPSTATYIAASK